VVINRLRVKIMFSSVSEMNDFSAAFQNETEVKIVSTGQDGSKPSFD